MNKKGVPIRKSSDLIELLSGEIYTAITPYSTAFDSKSAKENGFTLTEVRCLPEEECSELIQEVTWFPITMEWRPLSAGIVDYDDKE